MPERLTVSGLRNFLWEEIQRVRSGASDPKQASAVANLADKMLKSVELEISFREQHARLGNPFPIGELALSEAYEPTQVEKLGEPRFVRGKAMSGSK